ncbi:MAG: phosphatase PAP2 family protein [Candidatus Marinimicrobia bacterium]|nr:phosphatase PAP2 family protein [Candidatus Neomarinimicrobiota bacterium]
MKPRRYHFDRLILWYLGLIFALTFFGSYFGYLYFITALIHLVMIIMVLGITSVDAQSGPRAWLRWFYPLLLLLPLHYEIELVGTLFHAGQVYDGLVRTWDRWLFGGHPHRYLADLLPGPWWRELFHLLYLTYYPLVLGGFAVSWRQGRKSANRTELPVSPEFLRFAFVFMGTYISYQVIFILFPVVGPLDDRFLRFDGQGLLGPLIDWIYTLGNSAGGALPSSHVGEAVVIFLLLRPSAPWVRTGLLLVISGLAVSTVYCSFHYAIDALGGLITGPLFYLFWSWVYQRLGAEHKTGP